MKKNIIIITILLVGIYIYYTNSKEEKVYPQMNSKDIINIDKKFEHLDKMEDVFKNLLEVKDIYHKGKNYIIPEYIVKFFFKEEGSIDPQGKYHINKNLYLMKYIWISS